MGLDQVWLVIEKDATEPQVLFAHRKVPALEDFMAQVWAENNEGVFNCEELFTTLEIIEELRTAVLENNLKLDASGFFWGEHEQEHMAEILEACEEAETAIVERDATVYYTSWW